MVPDTAAWSRSLLVGQGIINSNQSFQFDYFSPSKTTHYLLAHNQPNSHDDRLPRHRPVCHPLYGAFSCLSIALRLLD